MFLISASWVVRCTGMSHWCLAGTEVWTQGLIVSKQVLYCLSYTFSPFCSGYIFFGDAVS
jgi:hypothetical protein